MFGCGISCFRLIMYKCLFCNMKKIILLLLPTVLLACGGPKYENPHVVIATNVGDVELELFPDKAPKTVAAFLSYIDSGYYNNGSFYRVLMTEGFSNDSNTGLIQGGMWQRSDKQHPNIPGIVHESTKQTGLSHTNGTVSLARLAVGTASTEFFICIGNQTQFDYGQGDDGEGFSAFGKVFEGMDVVRKIQREPSNGESFAPKIVISKITRR
jgi:peptidyl-prolyl cis-trans isomerase A (cyclophilin A)